MKITKVNTYRVRPRWCFVEIETDEGYTGWGEPILEGKAATVEACVHEMESYLIGYDPMRIEDIWEMLYRGGFYRGGGILMSAISGIDQALWDIKGHYFGVPVYQLMGGLVRDRIRVYAGIGGRTPEEYAKVAKQRQEAGYFAVKFGGTDAIQMLDTFDKIEGVIRNVAAIREACGPELGIAVDFHGRVAKPMAKVLTKQLEPYNLLFIEEPVLCDNMEDFIEIARSTSIPIATGERLFSRFDFKRLLATGAVDIVQPDLSHAGGITEVKKIGSMAEAFDVALAPHCPLGPIALASCIQVDATCYNAMCQENTVSGGKTPGEPYALDYLKNPEVLTFHDGWVDMPKGPGLGLEINKELVVEENKNPHMWKNPVWRHTDGSVAEW